MDLYSTDNYRDYLRLLVLKAPKKGYQTRLAEAAGCQKSLFSQILNGKSELTLEHAANLSLYLKFNDEETEYFLTVVQFARAGNAQLRGVLLKKIYQMKRRRQNLSKRLMKQTITKKEFEFKYYSHCQWAIIHMILNIRSFQTVAAISKKMGLEETIVEKRLSDMEKVGLVSKKSKTWQVTQKSIHLSRDSIMFEVNHFNWRQRAIQDISEGNEGSIHYSSVFSLSDVDVEKLRELILKFLEESRSVITRSKDEKLFAFSCDYFEI